MRVELDPDSQKSWKIDGGNKSQLFNTLVAISIGMCSGFL